MAEDVNLKKLLADLERCQRAADQMKLDIASVYISHAIEHVTYVDDAQSASPPTPSPTFLRSLKGGKVDD